MTMIHLILVDMVDQASALLAHHHGVLEINVGSVHVLGSTDLLPHLLHDHEPYLLPRAPHSSSVTSLLIHPRLLLLRLLLLRRLLLGGVIIPRRLRCSKHHGALHPWPSNKIMVNKIAIFVAVDWVGRRRIKKHNKMAGEIMVTKIWQMNNVINHVLIGRSSSSRRRRFTRRRRRR